MKIVINAGHTKYGKGTGASKYLNESTEARKVAYELMKLLADSKHEVIPAVYDRSANNLKEAVDLANNEQADLFISIHLNAGGGTGCEAYTWKGQQVAQAVKACSYLKKLGFKNRGIKDGSNLYVIRHTKCTTILIELCFVDNKADAELFKQVGYNNIAKALYSAIV